MKQCNKCRLPKPVGEFHRNVRRPDGYAGRCRPCQKVAARATYLRHRESNKQKSRDAYVRNREAWKERSHWNRVCKEFGISQKTYEQMLRSQRGVCAICGRPERTRTKKRLAIDHCHVTKKVRGLLCGACNTALGKFEDNVQFLQRAIEYIRTARTSC